MKQALELSGKQHSRHIRSMIEMGESLMLTTCQHSHQTSASQNKKGNQKIMMNENIV